VRRTPKVGLRRRRRRRRRRIGSRVGGCRVAGACETARRVAAALMRSGDRTAFKFKFKGYPDHTKQCTMRYYKPRY
jgi:hypothetical protein